MRTTRWEITGYDGDAVVYERSVSSSLTEKEVVLILARLAAQHHTRDEVVSSSLRKRDPAYSPQLEVRALRNTLTTIGNPRYVARYVSGEN
jgi:hypothetical protein